MMREINIFYSPCEVIRDINDLCQSDSEKDKEIRKLLWLLMKQSKKLSTDLQKYEPKHSLQWDKQTGDWQEKLKNRISEGYKYRE